MIGPPVVAQLILLPISQNTMLCIATQSTRHPKHARSCAGVYLPMQCMFAGPTPLSILTQVGSVVFTRFTAEVTNNSLCFTTCIKTRLHTRLKKLIAAISAIEKI